jgi:hypothetical protein
VKLGTVVEWTSQSQGSSKTKRGVIVAVVQGDQLPNREEYPQLYTGAGLGSWRHHESYVVQVGKKYYWPRVSALKEVKP